MGEEEATTIDPRLKHGTEINTRGWCVGHHAVDDVLHLKL